MKILKENVEYQGSPEEIAEFFALTEPRVAAQPLENQIPIDPYAPFEDVVSESEKLRRELAKDPSFNPFPNVSKSPDNEDRSEIVGSSSELNTGVEIV